MPGIFAVAFVALLLVQCSCNVIKSCFDSKTNDFFNFIFAPVLHMKSLVFCSLQLLRTRIT